MSRKNRRKFIQEALLVGVAAPLAVSAASAKDKTALNAPSTKSLKTFPDGISSVVGIMGDTRREPIYVTNLRRGVLSDPIELEGNGTYRLAVTPVARNEPGALFEVILADVDGTHLARMNIGTSTETIFSECGIASFTYYGVVVYIAHI